MNISEEDHRRLLTLADRHEIHDCVLRFCRGIDRMDRELVLSAYHPDALCDHGVMEGPVAAYVDFSLAAHRERQIAHNLLSLNHRCEFANDALAHTETYWLMIQTNREPPIRTMLAGRYLDTFEKRRGVWAISFRRALVEWRGAADDIPVPAEFAAQLLRSGVPARDRSDPSYQFGKVVSGSNTSTD
jgi:hypothetical protein